MKVQHTQPGHEERMNDPGKQQRRHGKTAARFGRSAPDSVS